MVGSPWDQRTFEQSVTRLQLGGAHSFVSAAKRPVQEREWEMLSVLQEHGIHCAAMCTSLNYPRETRLLWPGRNEEKGFHTFFDVEDLKNLLSTRAAWDLESFWDAAEEDMPNRLRPWNEYKKRLPSGRRTIQVVRKHEEEGQSQLAVDAVDERLADDLHRCYRAVLFFLKGRLFDEWGRPERALSNYDAAIAADRHHYAARENAAFLATAVDKEDATRRYRELANMCPANGPVLANLAKLLEEQDKLQQAHRYLFRAAHCDPDFRPLLTEREGKMSSKGVVRDLS